MRKRPTRCFRDEEYQSRRDQVRKRMNDEGIEVLVVASPENVYYLSGLDHMGYFAFQALLLARDGAPVLISRSMEKATIADLCPDCTHFGYEDGSEPPAEPTIEEREQSLPRLEGSEAMPTRGRRQRPGGVPAAVRRTVEALEHLGSTEGRIGIEMSASFMPYSITHGIIGRLPKAEIVDGSGIVDDCRIVQSPLELAHTRKAAKISDSMMLAAVAAAGSGIHKREVMAAIYDAMFRHQGTYPGFVPLVRSSGNIEHEHGTFQDVVLADGDLLFLEMAGCDRRYHAPIGRLAFIGRAPKRTARVQKVCAEAQLAAAEAIRPGVKAGTVYDHWQAVLDRAGLSGYRRHHCGYSVGIGFPPSWSGSGVPVGLRSGSEMILETHMVFHLMSWLLRTGSGDYFLSDTVVVTENGCEFLTHASRELMLR